MGCVLLIQFENDDTEAFNEIVEILNRYASFEHLRLNKEQVLRLPGIEIYPVRERSIEIVRNFTIPPFWQEHPFWGKNVYASSSYLTGRYAISRRMSLFSLKSQCTK